MRTGAERLDQLKVLLAQDFTRVAHGLLGGVLVDLVRAQRVSLGLPLRKRALLLLARLVHSRVVAVVQRAGRLARTLLLLAVVLNGVQQAVDGRHGCCANRW